jgi:hypothetical protein
MMTKERADTERETTLAKGIVAALIKMKTYDEDNTGKADESFVELIDYYNGGGIPGRELVSHCSERALIGCSTFSKSKRNEIIASYETAFWDFEYARDASSADAALEEADENGR